METLENQDILQFHGKKTINMRIYKPPESTSNMGRSIFLAGSIEMGTAGDWQKEATNYIVHKESELRKKSISARFDSVVNPRRDDWDSSWEQKFENPPFYQQVTWEVHNLTSADTVLFYFDPQTKAPITLNELGIVAGMQITGHKIKAVVVCPEGFWRKGNVDVLCFMAEIEQFDTLEKAINHLYS